MKRKIFSILFALVLAVGFVLGMAIPVGAIGATTLYEYWNTGDTGSYGSWEHPYNAQTFTTVANHTVDMVKLKLFRTGSPGDVTVSLRATDGSGHPTDTDLTSETINGNDFPTAPGDWYSIALSTPYELTYGTKYAIVVLDTGADVSNCIDWRVESPGTYTDGNCEYSDDSTNWSAISGADFMFEVWGPPPEEVWADDDWTSQDDVDAFNPSLTWQYDAFNSIQDGIDAVTTDGTVHVLDGEYFEAVTIDKSLILESDSGDWHDAYIEPPAGAAISLDADFGGDVTIDGLELYDGDYGIYINGLGSGGDIYILNCLIDWNGAGIYATGDLNGSITIDNCVIAGNSDDGIYLGNVEGVVHISNSFIGGYWDSSWGIFDGNGGDGIEINEIPLGSEGGAVYINHNVIAENGVNGIYVTGETVNGYLDIYNYNTIGAYDYNLEDDDVGYFNGNSECGILIETVGETGVVNIEDNRLAENGYDGICFYNGDDVPSIYGDVTINDNSIGAWTQYGDDESERFNGNGSDGIYVEQVYTDGSLAITNNRLAENDYDGIFIYETWGNTNISGNYAGSWTEEPPDFPEITYDGNGYTGIYVEGVPGGSLLIQGNNVSGNLLDYNSGDDSLGAITVMNNDFGSGAVTIDGNTVDANGDPYVGTGYDFGIYLNTVDYATISGNTITGHRDPADVEWFGGICLEVSSYNTISGNTITDNGEGIYLDENSDENSVENNTIQDNDYDGVGIGGDDNDITGNNISGNYDGIYIEGDDNDITGNTISNNTGALCGVRLNYGEGNVLHYNNITGNTGVDTYGVSNDNEFTTVDATLNWWGDASGPYHAVDNPTGLGDKVSDDVIFSPWLGYAAGTSPMTFIADDSGPEPADGYIKTAVNAAEDGDTVLVHPGTYNENNITIDKSSLTVQSVSGDWHDTIINATGGDGFRLLPYGGGPSQFHEDATIAGLTINNSTYGIYINGLATGNIVNITNCLIYNNGTGIYGEGGLDGDIYIDNCIIAENGITTGIRFSAIAGTVEITDSFIGSYWDGTTEYLGNDGNGIQIDSIYETGNVLIDNNIIAENDGYGISDAIAGCYGELTITNNIIGAYDYDPTEEDACFDGNSNWGIHIDYVDYTGVVYINSNKLAENSGGIRIEQNYGESTISNNFVGTWTQTIGVTHNGNNGMGILIDNTLDGSLLIQYNNVSQNTSHGIDVHNNDSGDGEVAISGNTIDENGSGGYGLYLGEVDDATVSGNTITNQSEDLWAGVFLGSSDYNTISDNTINDNFIGIHIDSESNNNSVVNNAIQNNTVDGIVIDGDDNEILGNTISNNTGSLLCGISLAESAGGNVIHFNNITGNTLGFSVGVYNTSGDAVDARWNWWGDKSGPYHPDTNPSGLGDEVSDNVNYDSWLGASVTGFAGQSGAGGEFDATEETGAWVYTTGGTADVYIAQYGSNPGSASFSGDTGKYVDVMVQNLVGVTEVEIRLYYTNAEIPAGVTESSLRLRWWDGDSWEECSDSGVDTTDIAGPPPAGAPYSGYMWAKIRNDTTPTLADLTGTPFGGGGSIGGSVWGGSGRDTIAPFIFNVKVQNITQTTVDVSWSTNEVGTSQVEYGASPSTLSPLDTNLVMSHLVHLTGLNPGTTYHYKVMSQDAASNPAVSVEYTFTTTLTPEGAPASFSVSGLSIQPLEIQAGEMVTITVSVANAGGTAGSYSVVLKINGVPEAEKGVTLAVGASQSVSFSLTKAEADSYSVDVNGLTGSFTVAAAETPAPIAWWIWLIVGVVVVGLIIFLLVRRRA